MAQALAAMVEHLLLHAPADACAQALDELLPDLAASADPGASKSAGGGPSSDDPRTHDMAQHEAGARLTAQAELLEGPDNTPSACDLALALGVMSLPAGLMSQRDTMLVAAAMAWPSDPAGVLALALLEEVVLSKGEAVLIPPGCPHAYVCGEVLEVQAASNNTIKGGLTAADEPTDKASLVAVITAGLAAPSDSSSNLAAAITAEAAAAAAAALSSSSLFEGPPEPVSPVPPPGSADALRLYQPAAVGEFQLWHVTAHGGEREVSLVMDPRPGLLLVTGGCGRAVIKAGAVADDRQLVDKTDLRAGDAFFVPAGASLSFTGSRASPDALEMWITTANTSFFTAAAPAGVTAHAQPSDDDDGAAAGGFTASEQAAAGIMAGVARI